MSKEIAQTVGGSKIAWLIAIVAAFAVFATVSLQSDVARADATIVCGSVDGDPPTGAIGTVPVGATIYCQATTGAAVSAVTWATTGTAAVTVGNANTLTTIGTAPTTTATFTPTTAGTFQVTVSFTDANGPHSPSETGQTTGTFTVAGVTSVVTPGVAGGVATVTFTIPAGVTYCSDPSIVSGDARAFTAADQTVVGLNVVTTTPSVALDTVAGTHVVTFTDDATPGGTVSISTRLATSAVSTGCTTTVSTVTAAAFPVPELRHMSDIANTVIARQEVNSNVRGSRHTICLVATDTGIDDADSDILADDPAPVAVMIPGITLANIVITNGGGPNPDTGDPTFTDVRIFTGDGTVTGLPTSTVTAGLAGATCVSWVSTEAGDQQINIVYTGVGGVGQFNASWDTNANGNGAPANGQPAPGANTSLIKEWNRLEDSLVTLSGGATGSAAGNSTTVPVITRSIGIVLNPATGLYQFSAVSISDLFRGNHINSAGVLEGLTAGVATPITLAGVRVTATITGCGILNSTTAGGTTITGVTALDASGAVILVDDAGAPLTFSFDEGPTGSNCGPGRTATITFTGAEPGPLGSGVGNVVTEIVVFNFLVNIAEKQVFLAWAGQRIILEHDWRIPAGDVDGGTGSESPLPNTGSTCPFFGVNGSGSVFVTHIKGSGPGNFLPGQGVNTDGSDEATAFMTTSDVSQTDGEDIIGDMNGMCISRVLYESEDQGQVDIEAFVDTDSDINATKIAWVIYYMKINTINISLVTQVSKPSHNSSNRTVGTAGQAADSTHLADYAPGNPWDASKDDADNAAEWNVSRDLLVRGRVTGWFVNSNPSGRAADTSNPLNVLPANRWVMPQDWPLLAGGPADPADGTDAVGTAEQFRPYYDIMFAPNNTRGISLATPEGTGFTFVTLTTANVANTVQNSAGSFRVATCADLALTPAGTTLLVGATTVTFVSCTGGYLTVTGLTATPTVGSQVAILSGTPFEGPYSTLDIVGLASQGLGGAALSDFDPNNIRDAALDDGDVDWWDAPMPAAPVSVSIRGTGFIKEVIKDEVYYLGTPNSSAQVYPNPYYIQDIPASPFIPAIVAGGGYFWDTWGSDGPGGLGQRVYRFWTPAIIGTNSEGFGDGTVTAAQATELAAIRVAYGDVTIARDLVVHSDNHGEFMVTANGDFKTDLTACTTNLLAGGKHCKPGDKVGTGTITATVDYPDFRGKHFPVLSNAATVTWTWGGYKDVTVESATGVDQFKYIVFHGLDRDAFCSPLGTGAVLLHPLLSGAANDTFNGNPAETVDFLIDSGEGIIVATSGGGTVNDGKQFATGVLTFSTALNDPAVTGILEFPLSSLAASGATDECQAWIRVSNSLLGILNVLTIAHDDEGNIGFDEIIDLTNTTSYTLNFRWSLITWAGADSISVNDAIKGTGTSGKNPGGNDISASVTAIYGWDAAAQQWLGFFPSGVNVPGANDLVSLRTGQAYWIAITGPSSVTWTIASNVN